MLGDRRPADVWLNVVLRIACDNAAEPPRPGRLAGRVADQVLADLDQGVDEAAAGGVLPQAVALELARIGLVVADDEVALGVEASSSGPASRRSLSHSTPTCHGRGRSFQLSVNEWIDSRLGVHAAGEAAVDDGVDGAVVGLVVEADAPLALGLVELAVAGDRRRRRRGA